MNHTYPSAHATPDRKGILFGRIPRANRSVITAVFCIVVFSGFVFGSLFVLIGLPLGYGSVVDIGGIFMMSSGIAIFGPLLLHSIALLFGRGLRWYLFLVLMPLLFSLSYFVMGPLANSVGKQRAFDAFAAQMASSSEPAGFTRDEKLQAGFGQFLRLLGAESKPTLYVRLEETPSAPIPPDSKADLVLWALDTDVKPDRQTDPKWWIDHVEQNYPATMLGHETARLMVEQFRESLHQSIPKQMLEVKELDSKQSGKGEFLLDVQLTSRHLGKYQKFTFHEGFRRSTLVAEFEVLWKIQLRDREGTVHYEGEWITRPGQKLEVKTTGDLYTPLHRSACHNMVRTFFGRLGVDPGPPMTVIEFQGY